MYIEISNSIGLALIIGTLTVLLIALLIVLCWLIRCNSKEKTEQMTYLDIHVYKKTLRGLSICLGITYLAILVILILAAYHLIATGL